MLRDIGYWSVILLLALVGLIAAGSGNMFGAVFLALAFLLVPMWAGEHGPVEEER